MSDQKPTPPRGRTFTGGNGLTFRELVEYVDQREKRLREDVRDDIKGAVEIMAKTIAVSQADDRRATFRWLIGTMLGVIGLLVALLSFALANFTALHP